MIKRGHYQSRVSLKSEKPEIIRVLGPNKHKLNYYKLQDGSNKSEVEIENEYIFMETVSVEDTAPKKNIFEFEPIEPSTTDTNQENNEQTYTIVTPQVSDTNKHIPISHTNNQLDARKLDMILGNQTHIISVLKELSATSDSIKPNIINKDKLSKTLSEGNPDILDVIRKIHINGEAAKPNIILPINILLDYDLSKVQALVGLFEFQIHDVIKTILLKTLDNPDNMDILIDSIVDAIHKSIVEKPDINSIKPDIDKHYTSTIDTRNDIKPDINSIKPDINTDINTDILNIDDFLNQYR